MMGRLGLMLGTLSFAAWGCIAPPHASTNPASAIVPESKIHPVTAAMAQDAQSQSEKSVPKLTLRDDQNRPQTLAALQKGRPALLYFMNFECPCCVDAHPFFARIAKGFGDNIAFIGVMNTTVARCAEWKKKRNFEGTILADESQALIRSIGAKAAVYSAVIDKGGKIVKVYPGYSQRQLDGLTNQLASESAFSPPTLKFDDAPAELTSGCEYEPVGK